MPVGRPRRPLRPPSRSRVFLYKLVKGIALLAALLALGLVSTLVAMELAMEKDRVEVPRVIGMDAKAAGELLTEASLASRVVADEFNAKVPKGHVSAQRPVAGTRAKLGTEIRLILSRGTDQQEVPKLGGVSLPQAQRILAEAGLTLGPILRIHAEGRSQETVIAQDPPAGAAATRGAPISLLVSLGPWEENVTLPDLLGRDLVSALNLLKELQLEARVSFERPASRVGHVVGQIPIPGSTVKVGSLVELEVGE